MFCSSVTLGKVIVNDGQLCRDCKRRDLEKEMSMKIRRLMFLMFLFPSFAFAQNRILDGQYVMSDGKMRIVIDVRAMPGNKYAISGGGASKEGNTCELEGIATIDNGKLNLNQCSFPIKYNKNSFTLGMPTGCERSEFCGVAAYVDGTYIMNTKKTSMENVTEGNKSSNTMVSVQPSAKTTSVNVSEFISSGWNFPLGKNIAEIKRHLGRPIKEERNRVVNRHDPKQVDEKYTLSYDGLAIEVYSVKGKPPQDFVESLVISSPKHKLKYGVTIGMPQSSIIGILGKPQSIEDGAFVYEADPDRVLLYFENNLLKRVVWAFYVD